MDVNYVVEDMFIFKYIGCSTVARSVYKSIKKEGCDGINLTWDRKKVNADISHYHTFGPIALLNRRLASGTKILTAHSTPRVNLGNLALSRAINNQYPRIYRKFDHIITISESCENEVREMVPEIPVTRISNGTDRNFFKPDTDKRERFREFWKIDPSEKVVLSVAQISPRKGFYDFMNMALFNPEIRFIWVGGFPYSFVSKDYFKIKRMIWHCPENVMFTGFVNDISEAYCAADAFVAPTYAETFGLAVLEALSSGLPVIARDIPEFREIYADNIMFFSEVDETKSMFNDDSKLKKYAAKARPSTEKYDIEGICKQHIALYRELME